MTFTSKIIAAAALLIVLCVGVLSYQSTVRDEDDRGWVTHTHLVLEKLQGIAIDISQAETSQRGYILTGQEKYLGPYRAGIDYVQQDIRDLRILTSDNPQQQETIKSLEPLVAARLAALAERMETRKRRGLVAGAAGVATGNNGGQLMDEIRERISEMRQKEEQLLVRRLGAAAASTRKMKAVIVLGNVLAVFILTAAGLVIHRETVRRNQAEGGLREVNERLECRTAELSAANAEMESFSYSVAHDLRAPLRHIAGYASVLREDYASQLDEEGQRLLRKLVEGAQRMGQLVDDLLSLSKIGLQELSLETTSLDLLLRQVVKELEGQCSGRRIEWQFNELFDARCDPALLKQVFVNLLSNAVKYTGKREDAVIRVGHRREKGERVVFVQDNGAGFEMQYVNKLFGVFQRLHKAGDFEGTGVGLAIAQRIIRKHGGRIWAEAEPNRGAMFFFTLGSPEIRRAKQPELAVKEEVVHV